MRHTPIVFGCAILTALSVGRVAAQERAAGTCADGERYTVALDIAYSCNCTRVSQGASPMWAFFSEPVIQSVDPDGAARELSPGDVVVAVNGHPITTEQGGRLFADLERGEPRQLQIRRDGRLKTLALAPRGRCEPIDASGAARAPKAGSRRPPAVLDTIPTSGYLGFGISARASASKQVGEPAVWRFYEPPAVSGVDDQGPAARAGLLPGDTITHINGVSITSEEAGRRFGAVQPGQTVAFGFRRGNTTGIATLVAARRVEDALGRVKALIWTSSEDGAWKVASTFTAQLDNIVVEVTGPARVERIGNRIIVRTNDGEVSVVVREAERGR